MAALPAPRHKQTALHAHRINAGGQIRGFRQTGIGCSAWLFCAVRQHAQHANYPAAWPPAWPPPCGNLPGWHAFSAWLQPYCTQTDAEPNVLPCPANNAIVTYASSCIHEISTECWNELSESTARLLVLWLHPIWVLICHRLLVYMKDERRSRRPLMQLVFYPAQVLHVHRSHCHTTNTAQQLSRCWLSALCSKQANLCTHILQQTPSPRCQPTPVHAGAACSLGWVSPAAAAAGSAV